MELKAIIFDVDGTLADTEQWGHLPACNDAFQQLGIDLHWSWDEFKVMIREIPGNANRLRHALKSQFPEIANRHEELIRKFTSLKQQLYNEKYVGQLKLRNGVTDFIEKAVSAQLQLAIVSTTHEAQIHQLLDSKLGRYKQHFEPILGKESGQKTGPEGMLYQKCLDLLELDANQCLVIEDSEGGFRAAEKAEIPTAVFFNEYTQDENFEGAALVAPGLDSINLDQLLEGHLLTNQYSK